MYCIFNKTAQVCIDFNNTISYASTDIRARGTTLYYITKGYKFDQFFVYQNFIDLTHDEYLQTSVLHADIDELILISNIFKFFEENKENITIELVEQIEVLLQQGTKND